MNITRRQIALSMAALLLVAACQPGALATQPPGTPGGTPGATPTGAAGTPGALTPVRLQLQWVIQSQFAGYFAAVDQGFYEDEGLDVTILQGAVDIVPQSVVVAGGAEFGVAWLPKVLASIEEGADLVNIAQPFQRSGTLQISWADSGIESPEDWRGRSVGTWGFGNEHELFAAMRKVGIDPENTSDVTVVAQDFTMDAFLARDLDAAQAMIYNEYAQVLEAANPDTSDLYQPEDLTIISMEDTGTAMLQDGIFARGVWLDDAANQDVAVRFLRASFRGWMWCRDNFDACVDVVLANGPQLPRTHQAWMLNEINALIWPSPDGIGIMDEAAYQRTVEVALEGEVSTEQPGDDVYRTDLAEQAHQGLEGDTEGASFERQTIELTEGGQ